MVTKLSIDVGLHDVLDSGGSRQSSFTVVDDSRRVLIGHSAIVYCAGKLETLVNSIERISWLCLIKFAHG